MKKAILAVSFGTTYHDTLEKNIAAIEADLAAAFPDRTLRRAFTSGMIIRRLKERDGLAIDNVTEALERLEAEGFEDVAAGAGFPDRLNEALMDRESYSIRFFLLDCMGRVENFFHRG